MKRMYDIEQKCKEELLDAITNYVQAEFEDDFGDVMYYMGMCHGIKRSIEYNTATFELWNNVYGYLALRRAKRKL